MNLGNSEFEVVDLHELAWSQFHHFFMSIYAVTVAFFWSPSSLVISLIDWVSLNSSSGIIVCRIMAFGNLSCCCPPRPISSIPDHNTLQGMSWEHTEGLPTPRWSGQKVCFQGFQKCTIFASKQAHTTLSPLGANVHPLFFALTGMIWP